MAVLEIVKWPDERLTTVCEPVAPNEEIGGLIADMFATMYDAPGRGLAAPQVGVLKRLFVMDSDWKDGDRSPVVCINSRIIERSDNMVRADEGCLSIPAMMIPVERPDWVVLEWTDGKAAPQSKRLSGTHARIAQHELDHLDGIVTFLRLDDAARVQAEAEYCAS